MPPRPPLPTEDLYARLGVPRDASPEAIEIAWRGLLRKHHPDVAGPDGLDLAKRINVAHDWLSDAELRRHYDRERQPVERVGRDGRYAARTSPPTRTTPNRTAPRRPPTLQERVASVVDRVARVSADDLDRLALAEPAPIAFLATLRRFVPAELASTMDLAVREALSGLPPTARRDPAIRDAITGKLADVVLGDALDELLGDPAGGRARERLTRGWDAAVGQPRYGPGTPAVLDLMDRLSDLMKPGIDELAATGSRQQLGDVPWPGSTSPEEDEALRVSSELASHDAEMAVAGAWPPAGPGQPSYRTVPAAARRAAARIAHLLVLRHAIDQAEFDRLAAPWLGDLVPRGAPWSARVRRRR
jgi:hypothetical protein